MSKKILSRLTLGASLLVLAPACGHASEAPPASKQESASEAPRAAKHKSASEAPPEAPPASKYESAADAPTASIDKSAVTLTASEQQAVAGFKTHLEEYLALHRKLEATLPALPKQATPEQVDANQRNLGGLLKSARAGAKQGEFFTPGLEALAKRILKTVMARPDGPSIKSSIMDENPGVPNLSVNDRYPDAVPLSTMPPEVLEALPKLDEDLEYRFIGQRLVLIDAHAHMIVDFTGDVLP